MTRYQHVLEILDAAVGGPNVGIGVHGAFWRGLSHDQFVAKKVLGLNLVTVGNGGQSNLVKALKGQSPFGQDLPNADPNATYDRMPSGLPPVADADISFIQKWIDEGCLEDTFAPSTIRAAVPAVMLNWHPTNAPVASSRTDDIWFIDPSVGWAVNSNGQIIHTSDGGDSWAEQLHDPTVYFRCVGFASRTRGWAGTLTAGKTLFQTTNGGETWSGVSNLPALAPSAVCGLSVLNEQVVFASGTNFPNRAPRMMKTLDGGQSWTAWEMRPWADILIDAYFTSPDRGWVVGGKADHATPTRQNVRAVVLFTEDGGRTWTNRAADLSDQLPLGEWGWKIQFINDKIGFVSLENFSAGAILRTDDGGMTWVRLDVNDAQKNANLEGVGFVDERHGWVGGWGDANFQRLSTSETFDGGHTWRDSNRIGRALNRFRFFGSPVSVGYASGQTVYKYSSDTARATAHALFAGPHRGKLIRNLDVTEADGPVKVGIFVPTGARHLAVRIWDRFGDEVKTAVSEANPAPGKRTIAWDLTNTAGQKTSPGHFIWRVTVDGISESKIIRTVP
jgi:photosystem II stability/assembly factor-like uncharacterized protein